MIERFELAALDARVHLVWAVLLLLALGLHAARRRRQALAAFGVDAEAGARVARRRALRLGLFAAGLVALLFAALQPRANPEPQRVRRKGRDLAVCLDVSRSMLANDLRPSRLEHAKLELARLADSLGGARIGLILFAGDAVVRCPLTSNTSYFKSALRDVSPASVPQGGTHIGDAIRKALSDLLGHDLAARGAASQGEGADGAAASGPRPKVAALESYADVLVITDGEDHESYPVHAARLARELGVGVFAVGLGSREGALIPLPDGEGYVEHDGAPVRSKFDPALLLEVVNAAGRGKLLPVGTQHFDLVDFYRRAIEQADGRVRDEEVLAWTEVYQPFALLGLALLLLSRAVPLGGVGLRTRARVLGGAAAAALAACALAPAPARAQPAASADAHTAPIDTTLAPGEDPFEAGARAWARGDRAAAAAAWEAVEGEGRAALLCRYDAAVARYELGDLERAIALAEQVSVQGTGELARRATALLARAHFDRGERRRTQPTEAEVAAASGAEAQGDPREAHAQRLVEAAAALRAAEVFYERVRPADEASRQGAQAAKVRRRQALAELAQLAREREEAERRASLDPPAKFLLQALRELRGARRLLQALTEAPPRRRRVPCREVAKQEEARRLLLEQLAFGLAQPDPSAPSPQGSPDDPAAQEAAEREAQRREAAAAALDEAVAASRRLEGAARGLDPAAAVAPATQQIAALQRALLLHPLDLAALTAELVRQQREVVALLDDPALLPAEEAEVALLCHVYGAVQATAGDAPAVPGAPPPLTEEQAAAIREKGAQAQEAAAKAHAQLEAGAREAARDPAATALALLEELQDLLPKPPPSLADRIREELMKQEEAQRASDGLAGLGADARQGELERLTSEERARAEQAAALAQEAAAAPPTQPAAEPLERARDAAQAAQEAFARQLAEEGSAAVTRAREALREALAALQGEQQPQDGQQQQPQPQGQDPQQEQQPEEGEAPQRLDPQQARRMMERMDAERREEEARLFQGGSGRAVEKDW